jgi:hypothetical protein
MIDKEILLTFINGPGSGLTVMVVALIASLVIIYGIKASARGDYERGKQAARQQGLENLQVTLAKLVHDQAEMRQQIVGTKHSFPDDSDYRQTNG